jgi:uncharacterized protein YggE
MSPDILSVWRFAAILVFAAAPMSRAESVPATCGLKEIVPTVQTTGTASVEVQPDIATIRLGVVTERPKAADAARENAQTVQAVVADIKAQGVAAKDIKTQAVALAPVYDEIKDGEGRSTRRVLRGYLARNDLNIRIRQLGKIGDLVGTWIDKGANRLESIDFDIEAKEVQYDALRVEAVRDALRKAQSYASGLGVRLGRIVSIAPPSQGPVTPHAPVAFNRAAASDAAFVVPVEPGVQTLRTEVEVVWEIAQ